MKYPRLSPEDEKAFLKALDSIWSIVAWDCLQGVADEKGIKTKKTDLGELTPAEQVSVPRSTVICITTDHFAGGIHNYEVIGKHGMSKEQYQRIREWMMSIPGHIVDKVAAKQFTCKRYGA